MFESLSTAAINNLKRNQTLLWLCQRYELNELEEPHDVGQDPVVVAGKYRDHLTLIDHQLAGFYWEAIWTDSVKGLLTQAIEDRVSAAASVAEKLICRPPIVLGTTPDSEGKIDTRDFVPVYCLLGQLQHPDPECRYGAHKSIKRMLYKLNLLHQLEKYSGRLLVILGAQMESDIKEVFETLDSLAQNLQVLLLWPISVPAPTILLDSLKIEICRGTISDFIQELYNLQGPSEYRHDEFRLLYDGTPVYLPKDILNSIVDSFCIVGADDISLSLTELDPAVEFRQFSQGVENVWHGYAYGFAFERPYLADSDKQLSLKDFILNELDTLSKSGASYGNTTITLPAENGSGVTTLLKFVAFAIAQMGYPIFLLREDQLAVNLDVLSNALNYLVNQASLKGNRQRAEVPSLLVFDVHHHLVDIGRIAEHLASRGRRVVVLRAVEPRFLDSSTSKSLIDKSTFKVRGRHLVLPRLESKVDAKELQQIQQHFNRLATTYNLGIEARSLADWEHFQKQQSFSTIDSMQQPESLFWVALYFFLFNRCEFSINFGGWLTRVTVNQSNRTLTDLNYIAAFSIYRLGTPLTTLNPSSSGSVWNDLIDQFAKNEGLKDLLSWGSEDFDHSEQIIRFRHPQLAYLFLKANNNSYVERPIQILWPLFKQLRGGSRTDIALIEQLVFQALKSSKQTPMHDLELYLESFAQIPSHIAQGSKIVLHHWARTLYHCVIMKENLMAKKRRTKLERRDRDMALYGDDIEEVEDKSEELDGILAKVNPDLWLKEAIAKLTRALNLPDNPLSSENPSFLYNTLGSIYFQQYKLFTVKGDTAQGQKALDNATANFEKAIRQQPDNYEALAAYGHRLLQIAETKPNYHRSLNDALHAMDLFDQAEEVMKEMAEYEETDDDRMFIVQQRNHAMRIIDPAKADKLADKLMAAKDESGYLIRARLLLDRYDSYGPLPDNDAALARVVDTLSLAIKDVPGPLSWRTIYFLYRAYRKHSRLRHDFNRCLQLLQELEKTRFNWHLRMHFEYAVFNYQVGNFSTGKAKFQEIRRLLENPHQPYKRFRTYLWSTADPSVPELITVRVKRIEETHSVYASVERFGHDVIIRPRWFPNPPREGEFVKCHIRFETKGPMAVPPTNDVQEL